MALTWSLGPVSLNLSTSNKASPWQASEDEKAYEGLAQDRTP